MSEETSASVDRCEPPGALWECSQEVSYTPRSDWVSRATGFPERLAFQSDWLSSDWGFPFVSSFFPGTEPHGYAIDRHYEPKRGCG